MKYIYGPVNSRRLGMSLGVSLTPYKICNFDCIYCQLGKTKDFTTERKEFVSIEEILEELKAWIENNQTQARSLHYITLSGFGEPTLNSKIGDLVLKIKKITNTPLAVITNASLLRDKEVRLALLESDLIVPSLDAATQAVFQKIDRPDESIKLEDIIEGLISLRREFRGKIWLEVMLASGVNDDFPHIRKLKEIIDRITPDKIQLNVPVRTTAEALVSKPDEKRLNKIKEILGDKCEIV
jgi:wyosine [tRNA(Phe)-imidazoG37] synthetase (radical SAM superfamily)